MCLLFMETVKVNLNIHGFTVKFPKCIYCERHEESTRGIFKHIGLMQRTKKLDWGHLVNKQKLFFFLLSVITA